MFERQTNEPPDISIESALWRLHMPGAAFSVSFFGSILGSKYRGIDENAGFYKARQHVRSQESIKTRISSYVLRSICRAS